MTGDPGYALACWIAGGVVSLIGALCYAELASAYPHAGGDYHFLTRAFGRDVSFLYGWARGAVINTGSIALLAFVFGDYATRLVALGPHSPALWAALLVVALTLVNVASLRASAHTQNWLTVVEVARTRRRVRRRTGRRAGGGRTRRRGSPPRRRAARSGSRWCSCC